MRKILFAGICFIYFILPFLYGGYSFTGITFIHIFSYVLFLAWILGSKDIKINYSYIPLGLFTTFLLISLYFSKTQAKSLQEFFNIANYLMIYFLIINIFSKEDIDRFFRVIFAGLFLILLYAFHQKFYGYQSIKDELTNLGLPYPTRFSSLFIHPNSLAGYVILVFPPILTYFILSKNIFAKLFCFTVGILSLLSFLLTKSYGGFISIIFSLLIYVICLSNNKIRALKFFSLILLIALLFVFIKKPDLSEKYKSLVGRLYFWKASISITYKYPLIGAGLDSFSEILPNHQVHGFYSRYAHNNYLQTAAEIGLSGLFFFLWVILYFIISSLYILRKELVRNDKLKTIGIFSAICGFLFHSFFDFDWNIPAITFLFFAYCGIMQIIKEDAVPIKFTAGRIIKIIFLCIIVLLSYKTAKLYISYFYFQDGERNYAKGKYTIASRKLQKAIKLNPKNPYYLSKLAEVYFRQNKKDEAIKASKKALLIYPFSSYFYAQVGTYYYESGNIKEAIRYFKNASSYYPNAAAYYYILGSIYQSQDDFEKAEIEYKKAIKLKDEYVFSGNSLQDIISSYSALAKIYLMQERLSEAKKMVKEILKYEPNNKLKFILEIEEK